MRETHEAAGRLLKQMGTAAGEDLAALDARLGYAAFRRGDTEAARTAYIKASIAAGISPLPMP